MSKPVTPPIPPSRFTSVNPGQPVSAAMREVAEAAEHSRWTVAYWEQVRLYKAATSWADREYRMMKIKKLLEVPS